MLAAMSNMSGDRLLGLRHAWRRLTRIPRHSAMIVLVVSAGIAPAATIAALAEAVWLRPLPYPESDRLVAVQHASPRAELPMNGLSAGSFLHYRDRGVTFDGLAVYADDVYTLLADDTAQLVHMALVSPSFFAVMGAAPSMGRLPAATDFQFGVRTGVLISDRLWRQRFNADPNIVGRPIQIRSMPSAVVVGVAAPAFHFPHPDTEAWLAWPQESMPDHLKAGVFGMYLKGVGRLKPGVTPDQAARDLQRLIGVMPEVFPDVSKAQLAKLDLRAKVTPLKDEVIGGIRPAMQALLAAVGFVLVVTWANAATLLLIQSGPLRTEIGLARALGASERHILWRVGSEGALLAAVGALVAAGVAYGVATIKLGFQAGDIPRLAEIRLEPVAMSLVFILALVTAGILAAVGIVAIRRNVPVTLGGLSKRITTGRGEQRVQRVLVVGQIALAVPLMLGSGLMARSFWSLSHAELGFQPEGALTVTVAVPPSDVSGDYYRDAAATHHRILEGLRAVPGVQDAEASTIFPLTPRANSYDVRIVPRGEGATSVEPRFALLSFSTPRYFRAMGIPLRAGREFTNADVNQEVPSAIVSERLALDLFGTSDVLGRKVAWAGRTRYPPLTIVGVVGDIAADSITTGPSKVLYLPNVFPPAMERVTGKIMDYIPDVQVYVVRTSLKAASFAPAVQRTIHDVDPALPVAGIGPVNDVVRRSMAQTRLTMFLLLVGATVTLFLSVAGLYGIVSYAVRRRRREIAVRLALGASPRSVVWMVVRESLVLSGVGLAGGLAAAFAVEGYIRSLLYRVEAADPLVVIAVSLVLVVAAMAATYLPARRAGRTESTALLAGR
jgi:putative ABC transport system permease protein